MTQQLNKVMELKSVYIDRTGDWCRSGNGTGKFYLKSEVDTALAEKDKEIEELKCQVNGLQNRSNLWYYNAVEEHKKFVQADKVIAELEESHKNEVKQLLILNSEQANAANMLRNSMEQVIFHQKYKRCLAMAIWCASRSASWCFDPADDKLHKSEFYEKWKLRWHELAEKFK